MASVPAMLKLYDSTESGNCYKVRQLLAHLSIPFERIDVSVLGDRDAARQKSLFPKNPIGRVPTVVLEDGECLAESAAILWYFATDTPYLPADHLGRCRVLQWLAFEQNNLEPNLATARYHLGVARTDPSPEQVATWHAGGNRVLGVMDRQLTTHEFFAVGRYTIADIALFAYTHTAEDGGFELGPYPAVRAWLERVRAQPGFVPMR